MASVSSPVLQVDEALIILLLLASLVGMLAIRFNIPYTVALVVCGIAVGGFAQTRPIPLTPDLVLLVFLPGLLFEAAIHLHLNLLRLTWRSVVLLAGPGVIITLAVVAILVHWWTGITWSGAILLGTMVAPTDPIAVLSIFRRLRLPRRLTTIVEGESLFNDGTGLVLFSVALALVQGQSIPVGRIIGLFLLEVAGGAAIGGVLGFLASRLTARVDDHLVEVTLSVALAYGAYVLAQGLGASGVISTITAGLIYGNYGRTIGMSERTQGALDDVWEYGAFALNSLVFLLLGTALNLQDLARHTTEIGLAVLATVLGRGLAVYGLGGFRNLLRRATMPLRWRHLIFWAGLRGALSLAMGLALPTTLNDRSLLIDLIAGIVLVTIVIQGSTVGPLARRLQ